MLSTLSFCNVPVALAVGLASTYSGLTSGIPNSKAIFFASLVPEVLTLTVGWPTTEVAVALTVPKPAASPWSPFGPGFGNWPKL